MSSPQNTKIWKTIKKGIILYKHFLFWCGLVTYYLFHITIVKKVKMSDIFKKDPETADFTAFWNMSRFLEEFPVIS